MRLNDGGRFINQVFCVFGTNTQFSKINSTANRQDKLMGIESTLNLIDVVVAKKFIQFFKVGTKRVTGFVLLTTYDLLPLNLFLHYI